MTKSRLMLAPLYDRCQNFVRKCDILITMAKELSYEPLLMMPLNWLTMKTPSFVQNLKVIHKPSCRQ